MPRLPEGAVKFLAAGGLASLLNWLVRFPLSLVLPFGVAVALAYAVGMVLGFGLYRSWVFPGSSVPLHQQAFRFVMVNALGFGAVLVCAKPLVAILALVGLPLALAEALGHGCAIAVGAVVNFVGHRALTFTRRDRDTPVSAIG